MPWNTRTCNRLTGDVNSPNLGKRAALRPFPWVGDEAEQGEAPEGGTYMGDLDAFMKKHQQSHRDLERSLDLVLE